MEEQPSRTQSADSNTLESTSQSLKKVCAIWDVEWGEYSGHGIGPFSDIREPS